MLRHSSPSRADRGVALCRVAAAAALAILQWLQPLVAGDGRLVLTILLAYGVWATIVLGVTLRRPAPLPALGLSAHLIDFLIFGGLLLVITPGAPPLLMYLLFPLASAAATLSPRGFIYSSIAALVIYGIAAALAVAGGASAGPVLLRILLLVIVSGLITHLRVSEEQLRRHLTSLAMWRHENSDDLPIREMLDRVIHMFRAPRVLLAWEENDEPWLHLAWRTADEFRWVRESPTRFDPPLSRQQEGAPFLCRRVSDGMPRVLTLRDGTIHESRGRILHPALVARFDIERAMGVPIEGATFSGLLLILDEQSLGPEDLYLGSLLGEFLSNRFDLHYLLEREAESAVADERIRLSRDLHDGVLQSLTGASLQIEAVRRTIATEPAAAIERLGEIQQILSFDQRELRAFIRQLRPAGSRSTSDIRLRTRLSDLRDRFRTQWGLEVEIDTSGLSQVIFHGLRNELFSLINEAVANAARHAEATRVTVKVFSSRDSVTIRIGDNGHGFSFHGRFTLRELDEARLGPVTLKERVASLAGDLTIESTPAGSTIELTIPFNWSEGSWLSAS